MHLLGTVPKCLIAIWKMSDLQHNFSLLMLIFLSIFLNLSLLEFNLYPFSCLLNRETFYLICTSMPPFLKNMHMVEGIGLHVCKGLRSKTQTVLSWSCFVIYLAVCLGSLFIWWTPCCPCDSFMAVLKCCSGISSSDPKTCL